MLAGFGLTGPSTIIEGQRGFCNIFSDRSDPSRITEALGETFHVGSASFKMFPTVGALHTTIVAVGRLVEEHGLKPGEIARVRVGLSKQALLHCTHITLPRDVIGAQFSLAFSVALAVARRGHDLALYMDPALWNDPELAAVMDRVEAYAHPTATEARRRYAAVEITLTDGRRFEAEETEMKGSPPNPASKAELDRKVRRLASTVLSPERVEALVNAVSGIETMVNVADLATLLVHDGVGEISSRMRRKGGME
jgi:2-methylcitrate dehydratase PrpD